MGKPIPVSELTGAVIGPTSQGAGPRVLFGGVPVAPADVPRGLGARMAPIDPPIVVVGESLVDALIRDRREGP